MRLRLRQIAVAVEDLAAARAEVAAIFGLERSHCDPGVARYGLENAVYAFGNTFLELLTPVAEGTTVGRLLAKRGGDGGYMVILQTDAIAQARARIDAAGVRVVDRLDRERAGFTHLHPRDVGGTLLSIDYMDHWERWEWAGPEWERRAARANDLAIVAAEMQGDDPEGMAARWSNLLDRRAAQAGDGWKITLDEGELRFVPLRDERGEGLRAVDVRAAGAAEINALAAERAQIAPDGSLRLWGISIRVGSAF